MNKIYTIGYGALEIDQFRDILISFNVSYLIDVRTSPYSKYKIYFNREYLSKYLAEYQIKYVYLGDKLGGMPKSKECYDENGKILYEVLKSKDFFKNGIDRLIKGLNKNYQLCLMCSENKPENCHRSKLIGEVLFYKGIEVLHILSNGLTLDHIKVRRKIIPPQIDLFQDGLKSRKSYTT